MNSSFLRFFFNLHRFSTSLSILIFSIAINSALCAPNHNAVCKTEVCKNTALKIREYMDESVKPCNNFYDFVCGNFKADMPPEEKLTQSSSIHLVMRKVDELLKSSIENGITSEDPESFRKLRSLYDLCLENDDGSMYEDEILDMKKAFKQLGGWPILEDSWDGSDFNWVELTLEAQKRGLKYEPFMSFHVIPDLIKNATGKHLALFQPSFKIPAELLVDDSLEKQLLLVYMKLIAETFDVDFDSPQAKRDLKNTYKFMIKLAQIGSSISELRLDKNQYMMSIRELQAKYPYVFSWKNYINSIISPYKTMQLDDEVRVIDVKYFTRLERLLAVTPKRTLANYVFWQMVIDMTPRAVFESKQKKKKEQSLEQSGECLTLLTTTMPLATGSLYVRRHFDSTKKDTVQEIFVDLLSTFKRIVKKVEWMDHETKMAAINKLNHMKLLIAYPDELLDNEKLDNYYKELTIDTRKPSNTVRNFIRFIDAKKFQSLNEPENKFDWTGIYGHAAVVNAFYNPLDNSVMFPAGILQKPFFDIDYPNYINYGGLGFFAGHEISHGLDKSDKILVEENDFANEDFLNKFGIQCLIDQYTSTFDKFKPSSVKLNGEATIGENIADNGGLKTSYEAYTSHHFYEPLLPGLEKYSNKQMFWITFAHDLCSVYNPDYLKKLMLIDEHPPNPFRVLGTLRNMPEFAADFNCPKGSFMNPTKRCKIL